MKVRRVKHHDADLRPLMLSLAEAAREYGFDSGTLREAIERGDLRASRPTARTIRIRRVDMDDWFETFLIRQAIESVGKPAKAKDPVIQKQLDRERPRKIRIKKTSRHRQHR